MKMNRFSVLRLLAMAAVLIAIAVGCSGGHSSPTTPDQARDASGVVLTLGQVTQTGNEIALPVLFSGAVDIHALSLRVGFDPSGLQPAKVDWSDIVSKDDSTFQLLNRRGFVPLALAIFGNPRGMNGRGTVCTLRFTVLDSTRAMPWIISDPQYLVAKDSEGRPVRCMVGGGMR